MDDREKKTKELRKDMINLARIVINDWINQRERDKNE